MRQKGPDLHRTAAPPHPRPHVAAVGIERRRRRIGRRGLLARRRRLQRGIRRIRSRQHSDCASTRCSRSTCRTSVGSVGHGNGQCGARRTARLPTCGAAAQHEGRQKRASTRAPDPSRARFAARRARGSLLWTSTVWAPPPSLPPLFSLPTLPTLPLFLAFLPTFPPSSLLRLTLAGACDACGRAGSCAKRAHVCVGGATASKRAGEWGGWSGGGAETAAVSFVKRRARASGGEV